MAFRNFKLIVNVDAISNIKRGYKHFKVLNKIFSHRNQCGFKQNMHMSREAAMYTNIQVE